MHAIQPLANLFVLAAFLIPASCDNQETHLALTLDGKPYAAADWQGAGLNDTIDPNEIEIGMCIHPSDGALAAVDDTYCLSFILARDSLDSLVTPASLRVAGTASVVDPDPGVPRDYLPGFVFVGDVGHAPEVRRAYIEHKQLAASWDGNQQQQVDGILQLQHASKTQCQGRVDIDVVGALPPVTLDVVVHAHMSGSFTARPPGI